MKNELKTTVAGSFDKAKPEIDLAIAQAKDLGLVVLAPEKGWLFKPRAMLNPKGFRPLKSEIGKTIKQIEDEFLDAISKSDFVYVVNPNGYIGETVAFEIGYAVASGIPIFSREQIPFNTFEDINQMKLVKRARIEEAIAEVRASLNNDK